MRFNKRDAIIPSIATAIPSVNKLYKRKEVSVSMKIRQHGGQKFSAVFGQRKKVITKGFDAIGMVIQLKLRYY